MTDTGADVLEIDYPVAIGRAAEIVGPNIALWGNLDPVGLLALADPPTVYRRTQELLKQVRASGVKRFVVSSGCTLAVVGSVIAQVAPTADECRQAQTRIVAVHGVRSGIVGLE